jgi:hypothetical protein
MAEREQLPQRRNSEAAVLEIAGIVCRVQWSRFSDGRLGEVFLNAGKSGTGQQIACADAAILSSLLLQHGVSADAILHSLTKLHDGSPAGQIGRAIAFIESDKAKRVPG